MSDFSPVFMLILIFIWKDSTCEYFCKKSLKIESISCHKMNIFTINSNMNIYFKNALQISLSNNNWEEKRRILAKKNVEYENTVHGMDINPVSPWQFQINLVDSFLLECGTASEILKWQSVFLNNFGRLNDFIDQKCLKLKLKSAFVPTWSWIFIQMDLSKII